MKILHLATSLTGGAGIAARRICEAQTKQGLASHRIAGNATSDYSLKPHEKLYKASLVKDLGSTVNTVFQKYALQNSNNLMTSISINKIKDVSFITEQFDLIHVHASYNFISLEKIVAISEKLPVAITLHDERYFTGGCHYSFGCHEYKSKCLNCPQVRTNFKSLPSIALRKGISAINRINKVEIISPSNWLTKIASESAVMKEKTIHTIVNPVPDIFTPTKKMYLDDNTLKIGFVSQDLYNPYKGLKVLIEAIKIIESRISIELRLFGSGKVSNSECFSTIVQSKFSSELDASKAYKSCDVLVVPSIQDNFPSVVTEALSCGIPVIGSNVGGITEVLQSFKMPIFSVGDSLELAKKIEEFSQNKSSYSSHLDAGDRFSYQKSANLHKEIYSKLIQTNTK